MSDRLLRIALRANAVFSGVSAGVLIAGGSALAEWLGIPTAIIVLVGLGLVPWAGFAWWTSRTLELTAVRVIIAGDIAWVVGAIVVLIGFGDDMTTAGVWSLALVSIGVADFAIAQSIGLRRLATPVPAR